MTRASIRKRRSQPKPTLVSARRSGPPTATVGCREPPGTRPTVVRSGRYVPADVTSAVDAPIVGAVVLLAGDDQHENEHDVEEEHDHGRDREVPPNAHLAPFGRRTSSPSLFSSLAPAHSPPLSRSRADDADTSSDTPTDVLRHFRAAVTLSLDSIDLL